MLDRKTKMLLWLELKIYDFRHSCDSLLIDSRANIILVVKYLGHTKLSYAQKQI